MEPILPLDILLYIIDLLASGYDSVRSLQNLSQACKFMVPLCRKHLFSSIVLVRNSSLPRFGNLLSKNPDIARYVKKLHYGVNNPISELELNILELLKEHSSLQSIVLSSARVDWNTLPESIRLSLVSLIQLPTVTRLIIDSFRVFPVMALSGCRNLIELMLGEPFIDPSEANSLHGVGPIVDSSRLRKAYFQVEFEGDIRQLNMLIMAATRLEYFYLTSE